MSDREKDLQAAQEIGKIYNSFVDRKLLCEFFLQSVPLFIGAEHGWLFMAGAGDKLWVETSSEGAPPSSPESEKTAESVFTKGQPLNSGDYLYLPMIVRNGAIGVSCFSAPSGTKFSEDNSLLAFNLTTQLAGTLKTIILFEQNLKMERLAAIGRTTSMVLHEIKNIMQLAVFAEQWIREGINSGNKKHLERGQAGMSKMLKDLDGFVYEMLSLTKDYQIQPQPVNLNEVLKELHDDLHARASQYNVKLDFGAAPELTDVQGEPRSIYRALLNIVKNAIEACDKKESCIRIRAKALDASSYEIEVSDNGQGMSDEVKANIFQAFYSTKGEKGTGLGLMIIDRTVKAHQGKIRVESELGKGTSFILTFPRQLAAPAAK